MAGCSSSSDKKKSAATITNLVSLEKPGTTPHQPSKVYIDSVETISGNGRLQLLIHGTFPDACTKLEDVTHHIRNDSLHLDFKAWRNPKVMCMQVLTSFSLIYDKIAQDTLSSHSNIIVNGTAYHY